MTEADAAAIEIVAETAEEADSADAIEAIVETAADEIEATEAREARDLERLNPRPIRQKPQRLKVRPSPRFPTSSRSEIGATTTTSTPDSGHEDSLYQIGALLPAGKGAFSLSLRVFNH